ncbi:hypothetical protein J6590_086381 [Homalodisca vitripennis]|nr:hypothetical protein J6590_086381 [Homalodisca vitripennis]
MSKTNLGSFSFICFAENFQIKPTAVNIATPYRVQLVVTIWQHRIKRYQTILLLLDRSERSKKSDFESDSDMEQVRVLPVTVPFYINTIDPVLY